MAMENEKHLDVEALEQICFERSKKWANMIEHISLRDDGEELHINEFDAIFEKNDADVDDADDDDGSDVDDFVVNDEVLAEITNLHKTRMEGKQKPKHKYDLPLVKIYDNHGEEEDLDKTEIENIVDETLPLLVEHKRRWEENGLERVLQSFDADKIERKVGSWLRRNNSVFSQNNKTVCYNAPPSHNHSKQSMTSRVPLQCKYKYYHRKDEDPATYSSDAESMHSVDTARYIKSSRRHVEPQSSFSSFCTKTTIKTYRMVKSKRDELREKYGCPEYDEEHSHRIQKMLHRRQQNHRQHDYSVAICQRKHPSDGHHVSSSQRRKHLIKRRSNFDMTVSLSEDDECEECIVVCNHKNRPIIKSPRCCSSIQRTRHKTSSSCGCSSTKHHGGKYVEPNKLKNMKCEQRDLLFENDWRPYRRETECSCCNETKLCKSVRHLANSSAEDWLVENGDSSESIKVSPKLDQSKALKEGEKFNSKDKKRVAGGGGSKNRNVTYVLETNQSAIKTISSRDNPKTSRSHLERNSRKNYALDSLSDSDDNYVPVKKKIHPPSLGAASESKTKSARKLSTSLDKSKEKQLMIRDKVAAQQKLNKKSTNDKNVVNLERNSTKNYSLDSLSDSDDNYTPVKKKPIRETTKDKVKSKMTHPPPPSASGSKMKSERKEPKEKQQIIPNKAATQQKENKNSTNNEYDVNLENNAAAIDDDNDTFEKDLQHAINISKMTYKEEMKRLAKDKEQKESCKKSKQQKDTSEKSLTTIEETITKIGESTFFSSKHDICNSTELDNNDKKIELKCIAMKHETAVSTTHHQGEGAGGNSNSISSSFCSNASSSKSKATKRTKTMKHSDTLRKIIELDDNDCTIVSSTTDADAAPQQMQQNETKLVPPSRPPKNKNKTVKQSHPSITKKGILLYAPTARDVAPSNSFHNGYFTITEEHLSGIIGKEAAQNFLKYYIGRRYFRTNSTIYFKPPSNISAAYRPEESSTTLGGGGDGGGGDPSLVSRCDDSDSDVDVFDKIGRYGQIYESFEK